MDARLRSFVDRGSFRAASWRASQATSFGTPSISKRILPGRITAQQIEAARVAMTRHIKRGGKIWIRIFPDKPITKKPAEVRMGKGKGTPEYFVARVTPGRIMFEVEGVPLEVAKEALRLAAQKLPVTTKFVTRNDYVEETI
jgi:large subunit ribosomal protein L16